MHYELQRISPIKYQVINKETSAIHSSWNRKKKALEQNRLLNMLHHQEGSGFFSDMVQGAKKMAIKQFRAFKI